MIGVLRGAGFFDRSPLPVGKRRKDPLRLAPEQALRVSLAAQQLLLPAMGDAVRKVCRGLDVGLWNVSTSKDWAYGSASVFKLLSVHPRFVDRSDNLTYSSG
jgi:hypothetical protein